MSLARSLPTLTVADLTGSPGQDVSLVKVRHELVINTVPEVIRAQVRHNIARGLPEMVQVSARPWWRRAIALCGSGPSLTQNVAALLRLSARGVKVMAFNAAIPALHDAGVPINYAMIWDATPEMARYAMAIAGCEWMLASRVNPALIDRLLDCGQRVTLWHAASTEPEMLALLSGRLMVYGGSTTATRGPFLAGAMGFRDIHAFGADSSYSADTHVGGSLRKENEIVCLFEGEAYRTTMWMMQQAESWVQFMLPELVPTGMRFAVYGDGLLPHAHRSWERQILAQWPRLKRLAWRHSPCW